MNKVFALIGNQNSGKSTLFNYLTDGKQHVGNFLGVTVEKKTGTIIDRNDITIVDLPGIYSLSPYSSEEVVTLNLLLREKPDAIINIIDATNIERSLYLSLQLMELNIPMIIALNMMDELLLNGSFIDTLKLEETLGIPVVPISANK
jgi:ferrous iron transport protein B